MAREPVAQEGVIARRGDQIASIQHGRETIEIVRQIADIDMDDLRSEFSRAGGNAIFFGAIAASAASNVRRAKLNLEIVKAQTSRRIRTAARTTMEKTTENSIAEEVLLDATVRAAEEGLIAAEERAGLLRSVMTATEQKHRSLGNLSGSVARELGLTNNEHGLDAAVRGRVADRNAVRGQ